MPGFSRSALPALLLLTACAGDNSEPAPQAQWTAGPTIDGKNYSAGTTISGNVITILEGGQLHYVTRSGKPDQTMHLSFHSDGPLIGVGCTSYSMVSLYFQKANDDWQSDGGRWWSGATFIDHAGDYAIDANMDGAWSSVQSMTSANSPDAFAAAKANANRVGFTFGNCTGLGHGAAGPGRVTITSFAAF